MIVSTLICTCYFLHILFPKAVPEKSSTCMCICHLLLSIRLVFRTLLCTFSPYQVLPSYNLSTASSILLLWIYTFYFHEEDECNTKSLENKNSKLQRFILLMLYTSTWIRDSKKFILVYRISLITEFKQKEMQVGGTGL